MVLYVDDILLIGNNIGMIISMKVWLSKTFQMKDLGEVTYILGIRVYRQIEKNNRFIPKSLLRKDVEEVQYARFQERIVTIQVWYPPIQDDVS